MKRKKQHLKIGKKVVKSKFEYDQYHILKGNLPHRALIEYETERLPYYTESDYIPDLIITFSDGRKFFLELKGNGRSFDHSVRKKMIAVKQQHPDKDIRILFWRDGKIGPVRKDGTFLKQSDWAKRYGFTYAVGSVPQDWLE